MAAFELRTAENVKSEAELLKKKERKKENDQEKEERSGKVNECFFFFFKSCTDNAETSQCYAFYF